MELSVIILNYNVRHFLELCLTSVVSATQNLDAEIIVVDNHSTDDSCQMVNQKFPDVKLIENSENFGFSKGNNIGAQHAKGKYLCILNPDTVVAEDTFIKVLEFAKTKANLGIVGCKLIDGTGCFLPESKRNVPTPMVATKKMLGFPKDYYATHINENNIGEVSILVGAFMLLKKDIYTTVGGFDERYFMYGDDIDLSFTIKNKGYQNYYFGKTSILHFKGESTLKDKIYAKRFYGAMQLFYKKYFKRNILFNIVVFIGVKLVTLFKTTPKEIKKTTNQFIYIGINIPTQITQKISSIKQQNHIETYANDVTYILDNNVLSFKQIISIINQKPKTSTARFRIIPKTAAFMVGSDDRATRGEVFHF